MFELYTKTFTIKGKEYTFVPLAGKDLAKFYKVLSGFNDAKKLSDAEGDNTAFLKHISEKDLADLHELCITMFTESYPDQDKKVISRFVSQNLFALLEPLTESNLGTEVEDGPTTR